jgi:hypothetical protein
MSKAPSARSAELATPGNTIPALILFTVVALAPLPFGSTNPTTTAVWCIVLGVCLASANPRGLTRKHYYLLGLAAAVVVAYGFVLHEQLAKHPWIATPHPIWAEASEVLGTQLEPSVSIARNEPYYSLGAPLAAGLTLISSFIVCADRVRARQLLTVVAWSGAGYAVYGIISFLIDPTMLLWREKEAYKTVLTATFINRNTAAVYFGSVSIIWLLFLCEQVRRQLPRGEIVWKSVPNRLLSETPRLMVLSFAMLFVCLAAMFMTGSRAGVVLSLLSAIVAFTLYFRRDLPRRSGIVVTLISALAVALVLLQFMGSGVSGRFDVHGLADGGRFEGYRATIRMIMDHPWFGTGLGTFVWSFPAYRSANISLWGTWDRAHNTLLEIASDMGVPIALLVAMSWIAILYTLIRGVLSRRRDLIIPVAALSVAIVAVLHSLIDFSLQIPGFAIVIFALVGAGLSQALNPRGKT